MFSVSSWKGKEKSIKWLRFARWEDNQGFEDDKVFKYLGVPYAEKNGGGFERRDQKENITGNW